EIKVKPACRHDLERINDIYNHYVVESTCTYQVDPESIETRTEWFQSRSEKHPVLVAHDLDQVVGWGAISAFKARTAYKNTGEISVYVDHRFLRQGIGIKILEALLAHARKSGLHTLLAAISADQESSIKIHEKLGFKHAGRLAEAGYKFDKWLDVVYMQYLIRDI
ncbi:MAG: hypothetical protein A2161_05825, partial [Candidatus Schekmanbacteria bacterium RBG_13_48_7]